MLSVGDDNTEAVISIHSTVCLLTLSIS